MNLNAKTKITTLCSLLGWVVISKQDDCFADERSLRFEIDRSDIESPRRMNKYHFPSNIHSNHGQPIFILIENFFLPVVLHSSFILKNASNYFFILSFKYILQTLQQSKYK